MLVNQYIVITLQNTHAKYIYIYIAYGFANGSHYDAFNWKRDMKRARDIIFSLIVTDSFCPGKINQIRQISL